MGGILLGKSFQLSLSLLVGLLLLFWLAYFSVLKFSKSSKRIPMTSILAYVMLVLFGMCLISKDQQAEDKSSSKDVDKAEAYVGEVLQFDLKKPNSFENIIEIKAVKKAGEWTKANGKVIVYHQLDSTFSPGMEVYISEPPGIVAGPLNPFEFNYAEFLKREGIQYRQFLGKKVHVLGKSKVNSLSHFLVRFKSRISQQLKSKIPNPSSNQVAQALLLGQKQYLDKDTRKAYSESGVMHILAVSGLHVGIIYALLLFLIKPLKLSSKARKTYLFLVILLIWFYALITGMSPSVLRASTMFSLISLGQMRERKPSIFNVLAFSAMLMMCFAPLVIFEVGFQLSYLAVLGIVMIQPLILRFWYPPNKWLEYVWQLVVVSLAAQLSTFPLTLFYFHAFPTYFLLGNLLIIPLTFLIMQIGIPLILLSWIPYLSDFLGWVVNFLIQFQNFLIGQIQQLPYNQLDRLTISVATMLLIWGILLIWKAWEEVSRRKLAWGALVMLFIWAGFRFKESVNTPSELLVFYQTDKGMLMDYSFHHQTRSWNSRVKVSDISFKIDPNRVQNQWVINPKTLFAIPRQDSTFYFPVLQMNWDSNTNQISFQGKTPKAVEFWKDGKWYQSNNSERIALEESPIRIVF
ncbi:ComEC/Rec2 family competence protein [Algoriphagus pacificus]|uniref:ComEC/Rec2 family competence protein n=1 Tax=Algoriphagus pacificus TaxID=2811234 RepID=UPI00293D7979|nr:ComEC/Rec2 family competence protein [Algoriphagus pacificus]